jgi:hypothetical protein
MSKTLRCACGDVACKNTFLICAEDNHIFINHALGKKDMMMYVNSKLAQEMINELQKIVDKDDVDAEYKQWLYEFRQGMIDSQWF